MKYIKRTLFCIAVIAVGLICKSPFVLVFLTLAGEIE